MANTDLDENEGADVAEPTSDTFDIESPPRPKKRASEEGTDYEDANPKSQRSQYRIYTSRNNSDESCKRKYSDCFKYMEDKREFQSPIKKYAKSKSERLFDSLQPETSMLAQIQTTYRIKPKHTIGPSLLGSGSRAIPIKNKKENYNLSTAPSKIPSLSFYGGGGSSGAFEYGSYSNPISKYRYGTSNTVVTPNYSKLAKERSNLLINKSPSYISPSYSPTRAALTTKSVTPNQNNVHRKLDFRVDEFTEKENSPDKIYSMNNITPKKTSSGFMPKRSFFSNSEGNKDEENKDKKEVYEIGFKNLGNTCYLNSSLQCLIGLRPFCHDVLSETQIESPLLTGLQDLLRSIEKRNPWFIRSAVENLQLRFGEIVDSNFKDTFKQHDASEFLSKLLQHISEQFNHDQQSPSKKDLNCFIEDNFESKVHERYTCKSCEKMREDNQKHLLMYLPIVESSYGNISTQSLMEQFLGTHQIKCSHCEEEEGACQAKLVTLPRVLILALKRYDNCGNKLLTPVTISPYLDLDKFVAEKCEPPKSFELPQDASKKTNASEPHEELPEDLSEIERAKWLSLQEEKKRKQEEEDEVAEALHLSLLENSNTDDWNDEDVKRVQMLPSNLKHAYRLTGIVNHLGDCPTSGHYKACVFRTEVDEWYEYNDMRVQQMPGSKVFGYDSKQDCYLLFYMHRSIFDAVSASKKS